MPTPPTTRRVTTVAPDSDGYVWNADWSSDAVARDLVTPSHAASLIDPATTSFAAHADDGIGSSFLRLDPVALGYDEVATATWFDHTRPIRVRMRFRQGPHTAGLGGDFIGLGVLLCGENEYDGVTLLPALGLYYPWPGNPGMCPSGGSIPFTPGNGAPVVDVEEEWDPATWTLRARCSTDGGATWGAWASRTNASHTHHSLSASFGAPVLAWFGNNHVGYCDVSTVRVAGAPLHGYQDGWGWVRGTMSGAAVYQGKDSAALNEPLGGMTGALADGAVMFSIAAGAPAAGSVNRAWTWRSEIIGLAAGAAYRELRFRVKNAGATRPGVLRITICNASTGAALPDSQVPGNSSGLTDVTAVQPATDLEPLGVQRVSLAAVPAGVEVFAYVEGQSYASDGTYANQATLQSLMFSIGPDLGIAATAPQLAIAPQLAAPSFRMSARAPSLVLAPQPFAPDGSFGRGGCFRTAFGETVAVRFYDGAFWVDAPISVLS